MAQVNESSTVEPAQRESHTMRWVIAICLVASGSFLLAIYDRYPPSSTEGDGFRTAGWLLITLSIIPVWYLGKRLLLYIPAAYLAVMVLPLAFASPAYQIMNGSSGSGVCRGVDGYISELQVAGANLDARLRIIKSSDSLSNSQMQVIIDATNNDIANLRAYSVPKAFEDVNRQHVVVFLGWVRVFESIRDGTYDNQMLFDLQKEDDEAERLMRDAVATCS